VTDIANYFDCIPLLSLRNTLASCDSQRWLVDSGLYAALVGGKFEHEAAA
jgi:hypothetical protein